jgi:hypothetical protein
MRMRRSIPVLLVLLCNCGGLQSVELASEGAPLRLSRVVMFENGLAHFERRGRADEGAVDLRVPSAQVDDVLRSLTIVDGGQAAITGVRMLPAGEGDDVTLRVGLATGGARDLRVTYVTEAPGWRPTYRLVVEDGGRVHVQGLAVVDTPTSEAWNDVALTLSTEVPLSFRFDLRTARAAHRPRFGPDGHLVVEPEPAAPPPALLAAAPRGVSEINLAYGMAQVDQPEVSTRAGHRVGASLDVAPAAPPATPASQPGSALLAFEDAPVEGGGVFSSVDGFDLGGGESGLVPFVDADTSGELALVFKPSPGGELSRTHPYRSVLFHNPSSAALLTGPVTIYAGDRFVGDGVTGSIPARAHAFVAYAIERSVTVAHAVEDAEDEVRATHLAGGVLTVELRAVHRETFTLTSTAPIEGRVFAFASGIDGFDPRELPEGTIQTGQGYFLPVPMGENGQGVVTLDLLRRSTASVNLASTPGHPYVSALLAFLGPGDDVERLREIADRLVVIRDDLVRVEEDLRVERVALEERRSAMEALRGISTGGAIRARLASAIAEGVGRVEELAGRATGLHAEEIALGQEWYGRLRSLAAR